jgi:hypothetical protein
MTVKQTSFLPYSKNRTTSAASRRPHKQTSFPHLIIRTDKLGNEVILRGASVATELVLSRKSGGNEVLNANNPANCLNCDFRMIKMILMISAATQTNHINQSNHLKITVQTNALKGRHQLLRRRIAPFQGLMYAWTDIGAVSKVFLKQFFL